MPKQANLTQATHLPDDFGTTLLDDVEATITDVRAQPWDYEGNLPADEQETLAIKLTLVSDDGVEPYEQFYSAGSLDGYRPSADGKSPCDLSPIEAKNWSDCDEDEQVSMSGRYIVFVQTERGSTPKKQRGGTNWHFLMKAILEAGFPAEMVTPDLGFLIGLRAHWNRVAQPKRRGLGDDKERTILVPAEIIELPNTGTPKAAAPKLQAAKPTKAPQLVQPSQPSAAVTTEPADSASAVAQVVANVILEQISSGNPVPKAEMLKAVLQADLAPAKKPEAIRMVNAGVESDLWDFDGSTYKLSGS